MMRLLTRTAMPGRGPMLAILAGLGLLGLAGSVTLIALVRLRSGPTIEVEQSRLDAPLLGTVREVSPSRPVPPLHFTDAKGRPMTLDAMHGRAVILNLWATWCVPCRKEMPSLDHLAARFGGSGFVVLPLSIDRQGIAVVAPFYRELGLTALDIYLDPTSKAASVVDASGLPTTLLVDTNGREVARVLGAAVWDSPEMIGAIRRILRLPAQAPGQRSGSLPNQPEGAN